MDNFKALRTIRTASQHLQGSPEAIFPLLCPVREYEWIEHWRCEMVFSISGIAEADCIFITDFGEPGGRDTWTVCRYEPGTCIEFIRVNVLRIMRYTITLAESETGGTTACWRQIITAINAEGNAYLRSLRDEDFNRQIASLETCLNHFLQTGRMLRQSPVTNEGS